jgi:hypothetical protein
MEGWWLYEATTTRSQARKCVEELDEEIKARIRKFIPAK